MNAPPLHRALFSLAPAPGRAVPGRGPAGVVASFDEHLDRAGTGRLPGAPPPVRRLAEAFVSTAFVEPLFALMRTSMTGDEGPFSPGAAERRFAPLLDRELAQHIVHGAGFPIVDRVVEELGPNAGDDPEKVIHDV